MAFYYAVAVGRQPGVYETWGKAKAQVEGYPGARYKKFDSRSEANAFVKGNGSVILGQLGIRMEVQSPQQQTLDVELVVPGPYATNNDSNALPSNDKSPHSPETIVAFTDGSAINNGRKNARAGYAVVFPNHPDFNMSAPLVGSNPTNNRAEYQALLQCLTIVESSIDRSGTRKLVVYTDSKLLLQSITLWMKGWKRKGWKKADGKPVLNQDLLQAIDEKLQSRRLEMHHVLAHTGRSDWKSKWNDVVDGLARAAAENSTQN